MTINFPIWVKTTPCTTATTGTITHDTHGTTHNHNIMPLDNHYFYGPCDSCGYKRGDQFYTMDHPTYGECGTHPADYKAGYGQ